MTLRLVAAPPEEEPAYQARAATVTGQYHRRAKTKPGNTSICGLPINAVGMPRRIVGDNRLCRRCFK